MYKVIEDDRNKPRCFRSPRPPPERASQSRLLRRQRQPLPGDEKKLRGASQVRAPSSFDAFFDSFFFKCVRNRFPFWILPFYPLSLSTRIVVSILGSLPLSFSSRDDAEEEEDNKDDENAARRGDAENIRAGAFQSAQTQRESPQDPL